MNSSKLGTQLIAIVVGIMALIIALTIIVMKTNSDNSISSTVQESCHDSVKVLDTEISSLLDDSAMYAGIFAADAEIVGGAEEGNSEKVLAAVDRLYNAGNMHTNHISVTDASGNILACYYTEANGVSVAEYSHIKEALQGNTVSTLGEDYEIRLAAVTGQPLKNAEGKVVGVVSVGFSLESAEILTDLKGDSIVDYTIFHANERINTTIVMKDGSSLVGTKMNGDIENVVINQGGAYEAEAVINECDYMTAYLPLKDYHGNVVGAAFAGHNLTEITAESTKTTAIIIVVVIVIAIVACIVLVTYINKKITSPVAKISEIANQMSNGNLKVHSDYKSNDEIGMLSSAINKTVEELNLYITDIESHLDSIAHGDLSVKVTNEYIGDFAAIKEAITKITASLNTTLSSINTASEQVNSGAEQVAMGAQSLSQGATEQASSIQQLSSSIMTVSDQINENAKNVNIANGYVQESRTGIENSNISMQQMLEAMNDINDSSAQINKIIKVIDDIAFQTNILALNAAVEAARAGTAGKGFAVVADEVRNLASKSADAVKQTTLLIQRAIESVEKGTAIAETTAKALEDAKEKTTMVVDTIEKIHKASGEQAEAINQITIGVEQISAVVQTNSATSEQSAAASEELSGQAQMLKEEISQFTFDASVASGYGYTPSSSNHTTYSAPSHSEKKAPIKIDLDGFDNDDKY